MTEFYLEYGYLGLFIASFLAATIVPIGSEVVFSALIIAGFDVHLCIIVGSTGNWLGGMVNYWVGMLGKDEWVEKYLKIKKEKIEKAKVWVARKGAGVAFFAFLPVIGDFIALVLGYLRANIYIVAITMLMGKTLRYVLLAYGVSLTIKWLSM